MDKLTESDKDCLKTDSLGCDEDAEKEKYFIYLTKSIKTKVFKMKSFGESIKELRESRNLPLRTVAAFLDIDQAILSKMERGLRKISRQQVLQLAGYFKVSEEELLISWLSDKMVDEIAHEEFGIKALHLAEEKVEYLVSRKNDSKEIERRIKDFFTKDGRVTKAWLFGSFARGENDYKSDIDLMIEVPEDLKFSLFDLSDIQYNLQRNLTKKVDLVMSKSLHPGIMARIKTDMKIVYEK